MATSPNSTKTASKVWFQAIAQAEALTLPDILWQRPQVQGITIDGPTSQDLDDAIYLEATPTGAIASIHIADVAELVTVGSTLDKVALARTQTRYLSRGNIPMLPHALSEDKLSLLEGQPRPTLTIRVTLNHQAEIQTTEIFESWIISAKRFSYEEADRVCQSPVHPFSELLQLCQTWAERLNQERRNQGAIGGLFNASGFWIDENGVATIPDGKLFHAQMIIQEFMILANRAVAHWFAERDVLALYRNHTARTIAPEREQIMQALLTTGSMELIRQKLQNWLNKAEYNPTLIGHFALNLTAYCHCTSPIRRLADLLNHRIIKALLHEQPHPYRKVELEQLCTYIATLTQEDDTETKEFYKERSQRSYQKQIEGTEATAALVALSDKEFGHIVKHAAKEDNFEPIQAAAMMRLEQEQLSIQSLSLMLIHSGDLTLQHRILAVLQQCPEDATSVLVLSIDQEPSWEQLDYVEAGQDMPPFLFWVEVSRAGQITTTRSPAQSQRKQTARHLACLNWLKAFVSDELVSPAQRQRPKLPAISTSQPETTEPAQIPDLAVHPTLSSPLEDGQNFVGLLQELSQSLGWPLPAYQFTGASPEFVCTCTVVVQGQSFSGKGITAQKKQAKHIAAKATLIQLQSWFQSGERVEIEQPELSATDTVEAQETQAAQATVSVSHPLLQKQLKDGQKFIGFLQQLCQTLGWDLPAYEFVGETPEFICTCTVWAEGKRFSGEATSSQKKKAKYFAAKVVLLELQQYFQGDSGMA
ncbi:MAG: exoribonuclease II [Phormidesmis priestleyi]|uniref:Exoribonuclease II n=1 Tax=Phormidesmis priestleyi TaxID=268141 RepID=A0A2W4XWI5_9CYAN|nr:MAG: exoribonuclease II [Phormidesmis priestleyi]